MYHTKFKKVEKQNPSFLRLVTLTNHDLLVDRVRMQNMTLTNCNSSIDHVRMQNSPVTTKSKKKCDHLAALLGNAGVRTPCKQKVMEELFENGYTPECMRGFFL